MIWKCKNKEINYGAGKVLLMGIVNVTPDSFSDAGKYFDADKAVAHALVLESEGADILDIGAQSTRPGYTEISPEEEWRRIEPVLKKLRGQTTLPISVDTYFPLVARRCIADGADIINDVSGVVCEDMANVVKESGSGWIIMHNGSGSCNDVKNFFANSIEKCEELGVCKDKICFDMGIGFGKTVEQCAELIANVEKYKPDGFPLLLGTSRKRVIGALSGQNEPSKRIFGNIAADTAAIFGGVDIIRLHDIKNEKQGIQTAQELRKWTR